MIPRLVAVGIGGVGENARGAIAWPRCRCSHRGGDCGIGVGSLRKTDETVASSRDVIPIKNRFSVAAGVIGFREGAHHAFVAAALSITAASRIAAVQPLAISPAIAGA